MAAGGLEIERKYLLAAPPGTEELRALGARAARIEQWYLSGTPDAPVRRVRRSESEGQVAYTYTEKRLLGGIVRGEREQSIDADAYARLARQAAPRFRPIRKTRYAFPYGGHVLELDVFDEPAGLVLLEIELARVDEPEPERPGVLAVIRDVSEDPAFYNVNLARGMARGTVPQTWRNEPAVPPERLPAVGHAEEEPVTERPLLERTAALAASYLAGLPDRPVAPPVDVAALRERLGGPLPDEPADPIAVVEALAAGADEGIVASAGARYFGFVIGGSLPAALAADWLTSAWDQNAGLYVASPATSVIEEVAAGWLVDLLGLPEGTGVGFVTGATMANASALAAARGAVLAAAGWDVEAQGLAGGPAVRVIVGDEVHASVLAGLRLLGLGAETAIRVAVDGQGRMRPDALAAILASMQGPTIVCAQAGNVNTGAIDPLEPIVQVAHDRGAWVHVDGAFGMWAAASPGLRALVIGMAGADSWATDAHKWLNVPYDCGIAFVADPVALRRAMSLTAAYLTPAPDAERDPFDWVPEASRRARATPVYAALRSLGRQGVAELVDRCCRLARHMAELLAREPGIRILNEVALNQVLVAFAPPAGAGTSDPAAFTREVVSAIARDGTCWAGATTWHGTPAMRVSISGWRTQDADIERSAAAIAACYRRVVAS